MSQGIPWVLAIPESIRYKEGEIQARQAIIELAYKDGMPALADRWLTPMIHRGQDRDDDLTARLTSMVMRANAAQHERQIRALIDRPNHTPLLPKIKCPVLLFVGRYDRWSPVSQHEEMLTELSNARLVIIEDAGHFSPIERPLEMIKALRTWIDGWRIVSTMP